MFTIHPASVYMDGDWRLSEEENWYTYTAADSIAINRGMLKNGKIQITPKHGTKLIYDEAGRRKYEHTINSQGDGVLKTLFYHPNNLLKYTLSSITGITGYEYDGKVARRKLYSTKNTNQECVYSHNGWLTVERFTDDVKKFKTKTKYDLNLLGYPEYQTTTMCNLDGDYIYEDKIKTDYVQFDTDKVSLISGTRYPKEGDKTQSTTRTSYDPNGNIETIVGKGQEPRYFITNSNNRIIQKSLGKDKKEFYFYTTSGQPLCRFGNIPQESLKKEVTNMDFDLNYHPVSEHFPPPTPSVCTVMPGDTFSSISERMYGDESFANLIADVNGFRKDEFPPVGLTQQIPNMVNTNLHNWHGQYPLYNPSAIIGGLYPHMPMPKQKIQKRKQPPFWHVLVEAIVSAAILAFAPEFAAAFSGVLGQLLGEALGFALAGAASNLMQQELALGFGTQKELSLSSIGQSALLSMGTAGIAKGLNMDLMRSPQYRSLFDQAIKNIELTIATQGLSFATGQQRHFDWRVLVASVGNAMANVGAGKMEFTNHFFNDALATASSSVASIGIYKMVGVDINSETIAANTLGTFIGNQLAAQAKQHYAEYQTKKYLEAEYQRSQIPEIGQELEASEKRFIQSVVTHPHEHGLPPPTSSSSQRSVPRAAVAHTMPVSHNKNTNNFVDKAPPQEHLLVERAREEEVMNRAARWNKEQSKTQTASQGGFWSLVERAGNSPVVAAINEIGDNVAHTVMDMVNPVKQFKTAMADADESIHAFQSGNILKGIASTGKTALDLLAFVPLEGFAVGTVRYGVAKVGARVGFFGGKGAENVLQIASKDANAFASRRTYLNEKFGRIGELHVDITSRGYLEKIETLDLYTPINKAVFYSGMGNRAKAAVFARETGCTILEMTPGGKWLDQEKLFDWLPERKAREIWNAASRQYATLSKGEVNAFTYGAYQDGIFMGIERPALLNNRNITRITYRYDPWLSTEYLSTSDFRSSLTIR